MKGMLILGSVKIWNPVHHDVAGRMVASSKGGISQPSGHVGNDTSLNKSYSVMA